RSMRPDIKRGIYPFKGITLSRADIEWLLVSHEDGRGPVDWSDVSQRNRKGLDLRGADLRQLDLRDLPLTSLYGGLTWEEWDSATIQQRDLAGVHLEGANLHSAHLEGARLRDAHLKGTVLRHAHLQEAR